MKTGNFSLNWFKILAEDQVLNRNDFIDEMPFTIYPNPTNSEFQIGLTNPQDGFSYEIINIYGESVK